MEDGTLGAIIFISCLILLPIILFITGRMAKRKLNKIIDDKETELEKYKSEAEILTDKYEGIIDIEEHIKQEIEKSNLGIQQDLAEAKAYINAEEDKLRNKTDRAERDISAEKAKAYSEIRAEKITAKALTDKANLIINGANEKSLTIIESARAVAKELTTKSNLKINGANEKALTIIESARTEADRVVTSAKTQAQEIAGDAYEAKEKADTYAKAIKAMKNTIEGYRDDYIIPNHPVLDDLADEFSHKEAGAELKKTRALVKLLVKQSMAGTCDYVEKQRKLYAEHFVVDAFNGKVDSALAKVKVDNYGKIKQEIIDAFALVNHNGKSFRDARINQDFLDARLDELKWAVATYELRQIELEEQREIKQQIREEEKAQREMDKAIKAAQKEEALIQKTLETARAELAGANDDQRLEFEAKLAELEGKLAEASERGVRAMSMAQQTRRGHVYVISNIGSFGEEVFKIGMTRRLEPMDRVKELGDASVPFSFDVHAMLYSEDAPKLEKELHEKFKLDSVNKINFRKEFFNVSLAAIKQAVDQQDIEEVHWTMKADAAEYRESLAITKQNEVAMAS
ncbi:DUF4041 domain-containing protein [Moritella viscosa]|uniref:Bacteriophage T5 Orf172 DNA-binding domain-containing protein n=1 Tax=Moritella viscosa TaxID=80854 RepID=A0A1K9ZFN1_9GAMM|nr:DUF4041 domain-containing protein [Moritella viscosa]SGY96085.1 Putative uncharacterized protein [Moritella viscosa]